jgi:hypothetical protein
LAVVPGMRNVTDWLGIEMDEEGRSCI